MKWLILLPVVFLTFNMCAQDDDNFRRVQIGINFSPDYCYRSLRSKEKSPGSTFVMKERNNMEIPKWGYTGGLDVCVNISDEIGYLQVYNTPPRVTGQRVCHSFFYNLTPVNLHW